MSSLLKKYLKFTFWVGIVSFWGETKLIFFETALYFLKRVCKTRCYELVQEDSKNWMGKIGHCERA